ncbi:MAG: bifunctional phosphoglucose/phosphomannose isomerase [Ignavibacterium sp.]|nr:bifunctional phosphoglucose/phosphomannose isomerase [Ignavibacterium sp.]
MKSINEFVKKNDPQNQFQILKDSYQQIDYALNNSYPDFSSFEINNIIISGLGGSAIAGDLIKNFLKDELRIPLIVNRNYTLPIFANEKTLVICSSYSGNTEETLSAYNDALQRKCKIICLSTGGELEKLAFKNNIPFIQLKRGFQPRYALGQSFASVLSVFSKLKLVQNQEDILWEIITLWKKRADEYSKENNPAFNIAESLLGFIPIIYSVSDFNNSIGMRFKAQLNENSKLHCFHNELPEMNHNEIIGWESHKQKNLCAKVIYILDDQIHPQIKRRFEIISDMIKSSDVEIITLKSSEENFKMRLMDLIYLTDWVSYYLAVLRGFDPSEIDFIHSLKNKLSEN